MSMDAVLAGLPKAARRMSAYDVVSYKALRRRMRLAGVKADVSALGPGDVLVVAQDGVYVASHTPYFYVLSRRRLSDRDVVDMLAVEAGEPMPGIDVEEVGNYTKGAEVTPPYNADGEPRPARLCALFEDGRWVKARIGRDCHAYVVATVTPGEVRVYREAAEAAGLAWSMANVRYPVRVAWDYGLRFLSQEPLYKREEPPEEAPWPSGKILVFDIEVWGGNLLLGYLEWDGGEPRRDDVGHLTACIGEGCSVPDQSDEIRRLLRSHRILYGFNILGFDLPQLGQAGLLEPEALLSSWLDASLIVNNYGQSLGVGEAKSLKAVAERLASDAGVTREELSEKELGKRVLKAGNLDEIARYNTNDVVLTAKIGRPILTFLFTQSAMLQVPPSVAQELSAGLLAEYFLARRMEALGVIVQYRRPSADLTGSKTVFAYRSPLDGKLVISMNPRGSKWESVIQGKRLRNIVVLDVKAMYPNFVLSNKLDPYVLPEARLNPLLKKREFDPRDEPWVALEEELERARRMLEEGIRSGKKPAVWETLRRVYELRMKTRRLKKQNPLFEPVDSATKAILNALAYGSLAKRGYVPFGNAYVAELIFHGTRVILYKLFALYHTVPELREYGCVPVYGDTDSVFFACSRRPSDEDAERLAQAVTERLIERYGLELEAKGVYDEMIYYTRKNYVLVKNGEVVEVKGGNLHGIVDKATPEALRGLLLEALARGYIERDAVKRAVYSLELDETALNCSEMMARMLFKVEKDRSETARIIARTPWSWLPAAPLLKLHATSFKDRNRIPLAWEAHGHGGVVDLRDYTGINILGVKGWPGAGKGSCVAERLRCDAVVVEEGRVYCLKYSDVYYIFSNGKRLPVSRLRSVDCRYRDESIIGWLGSDEEAITAEEALEMLTEEIVDFSKLVEDRGDDSDWLCRAPRLELVAYKGLEVREIDEKVYRDAVVACILENAKELRLKVR